jgi:hypothetical protein
MEENQMFQGRDGGREKTKNLLQRRMLHRLFFLPEKAMMRKTMTQHPRSYHQNWLRVSMSVTRLLCLHCLHVLNWRILKNGKD